MNFRIPLLLIFCLILTGYGISQSSARIRQEANMLFDHKKYEESIRLYDQYSKLEPGDLSILLPLGISYFHLRNIPASKSSLTGFLQKEDPDNALAYYFLASCLHQDLQFDQAITYYKEYLKRCKERDIYRSKAKGDIKRCAVGMRLKFQEKNAYIENMGNNVNAHDDDIAPVFSPNHSGKLYFTSSRPGSTGGLKNALGHADEVLGFYNSDLYTTELVNGIWSAAQSFSGTINSPKSELLLDFNSNGTVIYFFKGLTPYSGLIFSDTFGIVRNEGWEPSPLHLSLQPEQGDRDLYLFNDSTMLFSSAIPGGYGGYDLYISFYANGQWTKPENLGPDINTGYDELTPFLARDGRTLYYSSNSLHSLGGFDIMKAVFIDATNKWSLPANIGLPVNSASDELYFRLSSDGSNAVFCSDNSGGQGKQDIYLAYFKRPQPEQLVSSYPPAFVSAPLISSTDPKKMKTENIPVQIPEEQVSTENARLRDILVPLLNYGEGENVLQPVNTSKLDNVARILERYPDLKVLMECHSLPEGNVFTDLYFTVKRAEQGAQYLMDKGVLPSRLQIKGCGSEYPLVRQIGDSETAKNMQNLNRRINIFLDPGEHKTSLNILYDNPKINAIARDSSEIKYRTWLDGLSYKIQIAAARQMLQNNLLLKYPYATVEKNFEKNYYLYTLGLFKTYKEAYKLKRELQIGGAPNAFIVAYINGFRISRQESKKLFDEYPDLKNY